ncbi:MAG: hypothetical protein AABM64_05115 [Pseudomonadota bacterium]
MKLSPIVLLLLAVAAGPVPADEAANHIERANLLRKLLEDAPPVSAGESDLRAELPAARLEMEQQTAAERVQVERFQDVQWRQLLESQRASAHRQEQAPPLPRSVLAFEREQRARDLSIQIQRQDLEYRQNNRR